MRDVVLKVRKVLPRAQQRQAVWLFAIIAIVAVLEAAGVASIVPFMMVVANPQVLTQDGWLGKLYAWTGIGSENSFLIALGGAVFVVLLVSNALKALRTWLINSYTQLTAYALGTRLIRAYLAQSYDYFLTRHTAELGKNVLAEVHHVVDGVIQPGMTVLAHLVVAIFLCALLLISEPLLAISVVTVLGGAYALLYGGARLYLARIGQESFRANRERFHVASEAFAGVKEVKLRGLEGAYVTRFAEPSIRYARLHAANHTISQVPRYGLEVIAFGGILLLVLYLLAVRQKLEDALPLIALYAFAGYRMLPIVQEIFACTAKIRFYRPALDVLYRDISDKAARVDKPRPVAPLPFSTSIQLRRVAYRYPAGERPILHDIDLEVRKGARVAFIGPTGAGKSTVVDLILGLLRPTAGQVSIDGLLLDSEETIRRWQCQIGYVPQHIFLCDDTVLANIAFGEPVDAIDRKAAERAARLAQLHDFIVDELPHGYDTQVGERGIRLSGGQRQRLGLARALYRDPAVLVFDEATSALDTDTEDAVMRALDGLDADCTVIMIAHRLSTVRRCDVLFKLDTGRLVGSGSYEAVVGRNALTTV